MGSGVLPLAMATRPARPPLLIEVCLGTKRVVTSDLCVFERFAAPAASILILAAECGTQGRLRAISTGQLHALPRFHLRPINVVVYHGSRRDLVLR